MNSTTTTPSPSPPPPPLHHRSSPSNMISTLSTPCMSPLLTYNASDSTQARYFPGFCTPHAHSDNEDDSCPKPKSHIIDMSDEDEDDDSSDSSDSDSDGIHNNTLYAHTKSISKSLRRNSKSSRKSKSQRKSKSHSFFSSLHDQIRDCEESSDNTAAMVSASSAIMEEDSSAEEQDFTPHSLQSPQSPPVFVRPSSFSNLNLHHLNPAVLNNQQQQQYQQQQLQQLQQQQYHLQHQHPSHLNLQPHNKHTHLLQQPLNKSPSSSYLHKHSGVLSPPRTTARSNHSIQKGTSGSSSSTLGDHDNISKKRLQMLQIQLLKQQQLQLQHMWLQRSTQGASGASGAGGNGGHGLQPQRQQAQQLDERLLASRCTGGGSSQRSPAVLLASVTDADAASSKHERVLEEAAKRAQLGIMMRDLNQLEF